MTWLTALILTILVHLGKKMTVLHRRKNIAVQKATIIFIIM